MPYKADLLVFLRVGPVSQLEVLLGLTVVIDWHADTEVENRFSPSGEDGVQDIGVCDIISTDVAPLECSLALLLHSPHHLVCMHHGTVSTANVVCGKVVRDGRVTLLGGFYLLYHISFYFVFDCVYFLLIKT